MVTELSIFLLEGGGGKGGQGGEDKPETGEPAVTSLPTDDCFTNKSAFDFLPLKTLLGSS